MTTAIADVQQRLRATGQAERAKAAMRSDHAAEQPPEIPLLPTPCNVVKVRQWYRLEDAASRTWHVCFPGGATQEEAERWAWRNGYDVTVTQLDERP